VNLNFFYDPIHKQLELLGTDTRRQTNLDGVLRLPGAEQAALMPHIRLQYEEAGHIAVTVLESMLQQAFELGERFVAAAEKMSAPGVIGPFGLQSMIVAGPPKKEFVVFDVSPRMPGSPGISATPYGGYLHGESMSAGERVTLLNARSLMFARGKPDNHEPPEIVASSIRLGHPKNKLLMSAP
jgi:5-formaminoimidazole-4-carboxamide-1-(beta)-D-ribofuranosyl 5'-monophosphate synthetase